jgi:hypothetical protein
LELIFGLHFDNPIPFFDQIDKSVMVAIDLLNIFLGDLAPAGLAG